MIDVDRLEPGIRRWMARNAQISAELPQAQEWPTRRDRERRLSDRLAEELAGPVSPGAVIEDVAVPVSGGLYAKRVRPRRPDGAGTAGAAAEGPLPTQVYLHGGGFVSGTARERIHDVFLSDRAARTGIQIYALDYRLAPEHPYPAAVEDTLAFLDLLISQDTAPEWGADPSRVGVGGASAGGHVAAVAAVRWRSGAGAPGQPRTGRPPLIHQLLEIPALSFRLDWPSTREFAGPEEQQGAALVAMAYLGMDPSALAGLAPLGTAGAAGPQADGGAGALSAVAAALAGAAADPLFDLESLPLDALRGAPRALVMTAELDPLRDGAEAYAHHLEQAGVATRLRRGLGQLHGTQGLLASVPSSRAWQDAAVEELREAYRV